jgi:Chaperone of endosialidase
MALSRITNPFLNNSGYRTVTDTIATAGQTSFTIPGYTVGYLDVFRNGVKLATADFTATSGTTVVLTNAANLGDIITTIALYVSPLSIALPTTGGTITGNLSITGTETVPIITSPAATNLLIQSAATTAITIDTSQNVGVGVTPSASWSTGGGSVIQTPAGSLWNYSTSQVNLAQNYYFDGTNYKYKNTGVASSFDQASGSFFWKTAASGTAGNAITFTQAMTLDASGRLLVGTTTGPSGSAFQTVSSGSGSNEGGIQLTYGGGGGGGVSSAGGAGLRFFSFTGANGSETYTERARIDSSGNLLVGTTDASATTGNGIKIIKDRASTSGYNAVSVVSNASSSAYSTYELYTASGGAGYKFYVSYNGTISAVTTTITAISDQRLKENIRDLDDGLEKLMALKPRKFDWKEGKGANTKDARGFIAQEFETVFPDMIDEWKDPAPEGEEPYKAVNANLIPTLVKAIQEQQALITQLQADVAALKV